MSPLSRPLRAAATLVLAALATPWLPAQVPAPQPVLDAFAVSTATLQSLQLPWAASGPFTVDVVLGDQRTTLRLAPHEIRAPGFQLLVADATGVRQVPAPACNTFRGSADGLPGAVVAAQLVHGQLEALVLTGGEIWGVQPAQRAAAAYAADVHVVYRSADSALHGVHCGNTELVPHPAGGSVPASLILKEAEIAVDADFDYYTRQGSNVTSVQNAVTAILNGVDVIYRRDVQITYKLTTILVRTSRTYTNTNMSALLSEFANRWNGNHGNVVRDLAHLFTGKGSFSGVIGIAYLGVVCTNTAYGASKAFHTNLANNVGLVAHETGHNWNAPHCDSSSPCNIMCSGLGGCSRNVTAFAPVSINAILGFKPSRSCLSNAATMAPSITALTPSSTSAWNPGQVTVSGTELDTVTGVTVGGNATQFSVLSPTSLRLTLPNPTTIGMLPVQATNSVGPSNAVNLNVTGSHPSELVAPVILPRGIPFPFQVHTDAGWNAVLLASTQLAASAAPGIVNLAIGANFSDLFVVGTLVADARGQATVTLTAPASMLGGVMLHWQAITFATPALPLEVSNAKSTTIL